MRRCGRTGTGRSSLPRRFNNTMPVDFTLYLITDRQQVPGGDLLRAVERALIGGVRAVQLREKDLPAGELYRLARAMRLLTRRFGAQLLINDRIDIALAIEADGVHLGGDSLPVATARRLLGEKRLIGVSTHAVPEVEAASAAGADFVTFGPVFFTPSKAGYGAPVGCENLRQAAAATSLPVFALGGVKLDHLPQIVATGAAGIACISAILAAADPSIAAGTFIEKLNRMPDTDRP